MKILFSLIMAVAPLASSDVKPTTAAVDNVLAMMMETPVMLQRSEIRRDDDDEDDDDDHESSDRKPGDREGASRRDRGPRDGEERGREGRRPDGGDHRPESDGPKDGPQHRGEDREGSEVRGGRPPAHGRPEVGPGEDRPGSRRPDGAGETRDGHRPDSDRRPDGDHRPDGDKEGEHRGPRFGGRQGSMPGFGFGFGRGPMSFPRPERIAQDDDKNESGKRPEGDQPKMIHRPHMNVHGPKHVPGAHPNGPHGVPPLHGQPGPIHTPGGAAAVVGILFRLLDSDHNGSLSLHEFQRIADGPNVGSHPPMLQPPVMHSNGHQGPPHQRVAQRPQAPQIHAVPRRADRDHRGPGPGNSPDSRRSERPGDGRNNDSGHRTPRRGPGGADGIRPTQATIQTLESDWI